jgi:hypothetical protein
MRAIAGLVALVLVAASALAGACGLSDDCADILDECEDRSCCEPEMTCFVHGDGIPRCAYGGLTPFAEGR